MKFITSLVILSAATVSAKPAGNKECTRIYQRCLETITPDECPKGDRDCLCQAWDDMVTYVKPSNAWSLVPIRRDSGFQKKIRGDFANRSWK
ncbi:unnamed protein product [Fusarium graminearum]|nr:unnamed protein product [Fusarium graminearum]VTO89748.1 unnamed protein product [Fusarium graminearum]